MDLEEAVRLFTESDLHRAGELLVAGMSTLGAIWWPSNTRSFALAVDDTRDTNEFAARFRVVHGSTGRYCHDFRHIQALMHQATLISYDTLDHERFNVRLSPRGAVAIYRRTEATDKEKADVESLLRANWDRAYGRPWKDPRT